MAIAYESVATTAYTTTSSLVINKPTGLAEGDLMFSFINADNGALTQPTGWTLLWDNTTTTRTGAAWKVATAGDVAATDFTWGGGSATEMGGSILRISGATSSAIANTAGQNDTANGLHTWETPITPTQASSMLIMCIASPFSLDYSGYAIATSNPSWVEVTDQLTTTPDLCMAIAYAIRPEVTSTGNFSATMSSGAADAVGFLVSIAPLINATVTPDPSTVTVSVPTPTVGVGISISVMNVTISIPAPTVTTAAPDWLNPDKSATTWINIDKS